MNFLDRQDSREMEIMTSQNKESNLYPREINSIDIPNAGYRLNDNITRWQAIRCEIKAEKKALQKKTIIEFGSNFGFLSLSMAAEFANGSVYSIEGSFGTGNEGGNHAKKASEITLSKGIQSHLAIRNKYNLNNNYILPGIADNNLFKRIIDAGIQFDYQLSLSVFHWIVDASKNGESKNAREILANHLRLARTTFIELPDMKQGKPLPDVYKDYSSIAHAIAATCSEFGLRVRITYLCTCKWYGFRDTFRIDLIDDQNVKGRQDLMEHQSIIKVLGFEVV
jgi:hypothetical protein